MTSRSGAQVAPRWLTGSAWLLAALYVVIGFLMMWRAPRVPYADGWRFLTHFLMTPFPQDILAPDNGHHEVLPNIVRVLDLHVFAASQTLQVVVGILLMLATLLVAWRALRTLEPLAARAAASLALVVGLLWLGNERALMHANETVHAYFVTLFLVLGLALLTREHDQRAVGTTRMCAVAICGLAAAFSFGSGIACFAAFGVVLALRRAPTREWIVLGVGLALTLGLLQLSGGTGMQPIVAPIEQAGALLRWLAGPLVYAAWPLLDPTIAAHLPGPMHAPAVAVANAYEMHAGPAVLARWPHMVVGAGGLAWLAMLAFRAWREPRRVVLVGLGIAAFALAVGAMIVTLRLGYFRVNPEQLLAPRYVVWSSLFWSGLAIATIACAARPLRALTITIVIAAVLLPSQFWMGALGERMRETANRTALAAASGVIDPRLALGETVPLALLAALPPLREAHATMFAWPGMGWWGRVPNADAIMPIAVQDLGVQAVENRLAASGLYVRFALADAPGTRLMLLDHTGAMRGLAMRDPENPGLWIGWMQGHLPADAAPRVTFPTQSAASGSL